MTEKMPLCGRLDELRDLGPGVLQRVFSEIAEPRCQGRRNGLGRFGFGHADQANLLRGATRLLCGLAQVVADSLQAF